MKYVSTRGHGPVDFTQAVLDGLAPDGGLYLPATYPEFTAEQLAGFADMSYQQIAVEVMAPFVGP